MLHNAGTSTAESVGKRRLLLLGNGITVWGKIDTFLEMWSAIMSFRK